MKAAQFWRIDANMVWAKISSVPNNIVVKMNVAFFKKDFNGKIVNKLSKTFHTILTKPWKLYPPLEVFV